MMFVIDRFEGEFAVVEANDKVFNIPRALLPQDAREGSVIKISIDHNETQNRLQEAQEMLKSLFDETE